MAETRTRRTSSSGRKSSSERGTSRRRGSSSEPDPEADRYRRAAEDALQNLDWAIGYLHGIHKTAISKALAENRSHIRRRLLGWDEDPLPAQETDEE
jgi:hypothetical protein